MMTNRRGMRKNRCNDQQKKRLDRLENNLVAKQCDPGLMPVGSSSRFGCSKGDNLSYLPGAGQSCIAKETPCTSSSCS